MLLLSELIPKAVFAAPVVFAFSAPDPTAKFTYPDVFALNNVPIAMFDVMFPPPNPILIPRTLISLSNVLAPAKV